MLWSISGKESETAVDSNQKFSDARQYVKPNTNTLGVWSRYFMSENFIFFLAYIVNFIKKLVSHKFKLSGLKTEIQEHIACLQNFSYQ